MKIFNLYKTKLHPELDSLWQRPKKFVKNSDKTWFDKAPIGRDPLNNAMKQLSKNAKLSQEYKNHSIRATVVTNLDTKGFEARHIMATTGHKSEVSIKNYSKKCPSNKRKQMFDALSEKFVDNKKPKIEPSSTVTSPQKNEILQDPNFNLGMAQLETINDEDLCDIFGSDDAIETPDVLDIITQIEKENQVAVQNPQTMPQRQSASEQQSTNNTINIQTVQQRMRNMVPNMLFPHSNVTINYNFYNN